MLTNTDLTEDAKTHIGRWIEEVHVGGAGLPLATKEQLLAQLAGAAPVQRADGTLELVLPALSSLGVGIFQRSFRLDSVRVHVVPYGNS